MADETLLVLSGIGVPPYSARGLTQTLDPIAAAAHLRRTIDGELDDLSYDQFRKYQSTITCTDTDPPACDGQWPGQLVLVDCVAELCYPESSSPQRTVVIGSSRTENGFVFYRPQLEMRVINFNTSRDEYGRTVAWSMQLEEN